MLPSAAAASAAQNLPSQEQEDSSPNTEAGYPENGEPKEDGGEENVTVASPKEEEQEERPALHGSDQDNEEELIFDLESMKDSVFFLFPDRNQRLSRFWMLIVLASMIATSGIAGDSTATVIGAMIVAPLMTPILGTMLSIVLVDRRNFVFSLMLVLTGAGSAVLCGYIFGLILDDDVIIKENNSQVASRVSPKLTDLWGALATGAVGSIALVRKDIAGSLPGVAIAISLVPPLCVGGLAFATGDTSDALGALMLFMTNFLSILVVGVVVMLFYKVHLHSEQRASPHYHATAFVLLFLMLGSVGYFLTLTSISLQKQRDIENCLRAKTDAWATPKGWDTIVVVAREHATGGFSATVQVTGPPPVPELPSSDIDIVVCGVDDIEINFIPLVSVSV